MTAAELLCRGVVFVRNERASIVSMRGRRDLLAIASEQIARRVQALRDGAKPVRVLPRGWCISCGDPLPAPRTGGDCELCTAALRAFLKEQGIRL